MIGTTRLPSPATLHPNMHSGFAILGLTQMIIGLSALFAADFLPVFDVLAVISGTIGIVTLLYCIARPELVKVYDILGATFLVAYGTGTMNSVISYAIGHHELLPGPAFSQYWYTRTLALVVSACGFLHLIGRIDNDGFLLRVDVKLPGEPTRVLNVVTPILLLMTALLATGRIRFMANVSANGGAEVSPLAVVAVLLGTPAGALALAEAVKLKQGFLFVLLMLGSALLLLFQFGLGRRAFLISLMVYFVSAIYVLRPKRLLSVRNVVLVVIAATTLYAASTAFYALRLASWSYGAQAMQHVGFAELIPKAIEIYEQDRDGKIQAKLAENVKSRTFVLQYLTQIAQGEAERDPLYGLDFYRAIIYATPSILYPGKFQDPLFESEEPLINPVFGLPVIDGPNSILTAGMADFGVTGLFLYPLVLCLTLSLILRFVYRFAPPPAGLFIGFFFCQSLLTAETDIAAYLSSMRSMIPFAMILWIYFAWNRKDGGRARSGFRQGPF